MLDENFDYNCINTTIHKNPNSNTFEEISTAIKQNDGYCCCAISKTKDTKCICTTFKNSVDSGFCHCGRYYKVNEFPVLTILYHPNNFEKAKELARSFNKQGFNILMPFYSSLREYLDNFKVYDETTMDMVHRANAVFVLNDSEEAVEFMKQFIYWAIELNKKICYSETEEINDENRETKNI